ncbi:urea amidolyase [bacterium]|nr:urea amidolyase [bacterium]
MTRGLTVQTTGPAVSVQDAGRANGLGLGLSRSGAADRMAYLEGCALLGLPLGTAMIEMAGFGGTFCFHDVTRFALAGAAMRASLDGQPVEWGAAHLAGPGSVLTIGAAETGVYGYLALGGGIATEPELGGRGFHRIAGLGRALADGDEVPLGVDAGLADAPMRLTAAPPPKGPIRAMPGPQTALFPAEVIALFQATTFTRSVKANRQGVRMDHDGGPFSVGSQLNQVSDFIAEGDIQMTGDGTPYVLLADCQTMGGYPRIGTVLPIDQARIVQALPGDKMRFELVTIAQAEALWQSEATLLAGLKRRLQPRVRDPHEMADLLSYDLIGRPLPEVSGLEE